MDRREKAQSLNKKKRDTYKMLFPIRMHALKFDLELKTFRKQN